MTDNKKISKTQRILAVYHLFIHCYGVSVNVLNKLGVSGRSVKRYIALLKAAGVLAARYDGKEREYYKESLELRPIAGENSPNRLKYLKRIRRLCILMCEVTWLEESEQSKTKLYRELFPEESDRTRQRDYAELKKLGYNLHPGMIDGEDWHMKRGWIYDVPSAYGVKPLLQKP